jgi:hypothetical protein
VPADRSRAEIESTLRRYGATKFAYGWEEGDAGEQVAQLVFEAHARRVRFRLPLPPKSQFKLSPSGQTRHNSANVEKAWEQACRQRWRALALVIKAKLEAVECQITSFESEFLAHIVIPADGRTIGEWAAPQLEKAYEQGSRLPLLPATTDR